MKGEKHKWTTQEEKKLEELYNKDYSIAKIAETLGRTHGSVECKCKLKGLRHGYIVDVLFPQDAQQWDYFFRKVRESYNKATLLKNLGEGYTQSIFLEILEEAVTLDVISIYKFNNIVDRLKFTKTATYSKFKRHSVLEKRAII